MHDIAAMLERQATWQRSRAKLTWTEKLRLAAQLRDAALAMRRPVIESAPPAGKP